MQVENTKLDGVKLIKPAIFEDFRGLYVETYNRDQYQKSGIDVEFKQDDISISSRNVLRGSGWQHDQRHAREANR